ncbi:PREDICTED: cellular retinoic acid-binding protein 2-like [Priapulus caudatus]|uniref:Cellular retinoic acid-binding protein 2-like n=1 Tax=Priapulus caudatus TaxID=37621 RepID=A0ABM1F9M9_PRICU|nr:PREDICTED: cellular retinoic acid-binding protein 2-like [Priapulus caudatus]
MANISGKWKLEKSENMEAYLKAKGMGSMKTKMMMTASPSLDIDQLSDTEYKIKMYTTMKTAIDDHFTIGVTFEGKRDGKTVKITCTRDENKLIAEEVGEDGEKDLIIREVMPDGSLVVRVEYKGAKATRYFKKK